MASLSPDEQLPKLSVLVAYPYLNAGMQRMLVEHKPSLRFLLDSGAFTAWKAGKAISLDDYCTFIERLPVSPWRYFTLDVIGDPAGTLRNYDLMLKRGFHPVPIFTRGEDPAVLEDYYKTSDVVGIGGLVGTVGNRGFVNGIMRKVAGRRCHWLGFTSLPYLKHYRPYMCDTSSWETGARFATFKLYLGKGRTCLLTKGRCVTSPLPEVLQALRSYGVRPNDVATTGWWAGTLSGSRRLGAHSFVRLSLEMQQQLGVLSFAAVTVTNSFNLLLSGYHYEMAKRRRTHGPTANLADLVGGSGQRDPGLLPDVTGA